MLIFAIVVLIALGPKRLPEFMRTVGKGLREVRKAAGELRKHSGIDELMRDDPIGMRALNRDIQRAPAPRRDHKLTAKDRAQELPREGVDLNFAKHLEGEHRKDNVAVAPAVAVGTESKAPSDPKAPSEPAPPVKDAKAVDNAEPTMMGIPAVDPYADAKTEATAPAPSTPARPSSAPSIPPPVPTEAKRASIPPPPRTPS
ncbi:MAG: twin-arginine translocase TatA/TatE family subunit, partial [Myxococcota bacterium]